MKKDIPCNDIVMLKIREGKLITTIGNRSNDLHLGLPTNIFQFSFLTELIAGALGVELGTQTHNSQSLHVYSWNKSAEVMDKIFEARYLSFRYAGKKIPIRAGVVLRELKLRPRKLYMVDDETTAKAGLQSMGLFSYTNLQFVPRSVQTLDSLGNVQYCSLRH